MEKMTKKQLQKAWKNLDLACETLENLREAGVDIAEFFIDFSAIVCLKNEIEIVIEQKSRGKKSHGNIN